MNGGSSRRETAILLAVYATFALDAFSALTSSPQTTEINAAARADTLMKWVKFSVIVVVAAGAIGSYVDGTIRPLLATVIVGGIMYGIYVHAKNAGLSNGGPATESYSSGW
jgi:hypothetical protein